MKKTKTKQQRKMAVLRDALAQVKAKKYKARFGSIFDPKWNGVLYNKLEESVDNDQVRNILNTELKKKDEYCEICARGCLLVSRIKLENKFKVEDYRNITGGNFDDSSVEDQYLMKLFSKRELAMMENAFETSNYRDFPINSEYLSDEDNDSSWKFGKKYKSANMKLIKILENAIAHKGTFTP